jgi:hypothetical protein
MRRLRFGTMPNLGMIYDPLVCVIEPYSTKRCGLCNRASRGTVKNATLASQCYGFAFRDVCWCFDLKRALPSNMRVPRDQAM